MSIGWAHAGPSILAAFLASTVEFVEALTVVLAVGSVRGWRAALGGSAVAVIVLLALVAVLGTALTRIPLAFVQLAVGTLLLLFGLRWLRKAILRAAGGVGVLLSAFGCFWAGEGIGLDWPGADWSILGLIAGFLATALLAVPLCRARAVGQPIRSPR
ncbi:MAG: hypothetical protein ABI369_06090 [Acetobacteraceae bacterium]